MYRRPSRVFAVIFAFVSLSVPGFAWDEAGHKISAYIAWQQMLPHVRERVIKTLLEAPEDAQLSTFYLTYGTRTEQARKREFFMFASTWADVIRDRNFDTRYKKYHRGNWHYSDTFWTVRNGRIEYLPASEDGGKALEKLNEFDKMLRSATRDSEKAVAIAWIEHLVGDLHQPLHTSARVTNTEPKGDQGGNLFLLTPQGTPRDKQENLHWFWDSIVVRNTPNEKDECDAEFLDPIAEKIMKRYPYRQMQSRVAPGRFEDWIKESLSTAQTDVFSPDLKRFEMPSSGYKKKAFKVAQERLALAGYRMADLFNAAFGAAPTPQ
ncbi:MAG: S1/P1 nuclease [Pyrinomonadaceae bacterium]